MKSTTVECKHCKGSGTLPLTKKECSGCGGYGYNHPPKKAGQVRRLLQGEKFFFLMPWEDDPKKEWAHTDYVELNGAGCLVIGDAEACFVEFDRGHNFFFTIEEARAAIKDIRRIINKAK